MWPSVCTDTAPPEAEESLTASGARLGGNEGRAPTVSRAPLLGTEWVGGPTHSPGLRRNVISMAVPAAEQAVAPLWRVTDMPSGYMRGRACVGRRESE